MWPVDDPLVVLLYLCIINQCVSEAKVLEVCLVCSTRLGFITYSDLESLLVLTLIILEFFLILFLPSI